MRFLFMMAACLLSTPGFTQSEQNPLREAYPICFDAFPDESSVEHAVCIELSARHASTGWTRPKLEEAVRLHLAKQRDDAAAHLAKERDAAAAQEKLDAYRGDPNTLEFKGIALGLDLATIQATGRYSCQDPKSPLADQACSLKYRERESIAGAPVKHLSLFFYGDKLHGISVTFSESDFGAVASALTEKYGRPEVSTETMQNRMGATFENRRLNWTKPSGSVEARRYSGQLDISSVRWHSPSYVKEFAARKKSSGKSGAKDL